MRFADSCSGVSSWMAKNHALGMVSSTGVAACCGAATGVTATGLGLGVYVGMDPLRAASMEKGRAGLLLFCANGGSTRRKGELEARRLEMAWTRLFLGEPRLVLMGVDFAVLGEERALRTEGRVGVVVRLAVGFRGAVKREKAAGLTKPASLKVLDLLVGVQKRDGSIFSEESSSKISGARWRFPVDAVGDGLSGVANVGEGAVSRVNLGFPLMFVGASYHFACSWRFARPGDARSQTRQRAGA